MKPEDLRSLKEKYPDKSFVYVFQTTKTGNFRGANTFQHDVDIVIEIPQRGKAVQFGRFNQGGEIQIFDDAIPQASEELNGTSKKVKYPAWTTPKHLDKEDHSTLKYIYDLYKKGALKEAYEYATYNADTVIREEIPGDIWKKMGGQLTERGEEILKRKKQKIKPEEAESKPKKRYLPFNGGVRILKGVFETNYELELTDSEYIDILLIAQDDDRFYDLVMNMDQKLSEFLIIMNNAYKKWNIEKDLSGTRKKKFDPEKYDDRSDAENPTYIFSLTSTRVLVEAIKKEFDLLYMAKRELANRGQDQNGNWVGFDQAKRIHKL